MQDIYNLGIKNISELMSIDPILNPDWEQTLKKILRNLDNDAQKIVYQNILAPKGIHYNSTLKVFVAKQPQNLQNTIKSLNIQNRQLLKAAEILTDICTTPPPTIPTMPYCSSMSWKLP